MLRSPLFSLTLLLAACGTATLDTSGSDTADTSGSDTADTAETGDSTDTQDTADSGDTADTADTGDTGLDPEWAHCPDASAYVGDAGWLGQLQVTRDAEYCALPNEARDLAGELAAKARMRVVAGTYPMPTEEGTYPFALPVCTIRADATAQPAMNGQGTTATDPKTYGSSTYTYEIGTQPMTTTGGVPWTLGQSIILAGPAGSAPNPLVLDGRVPDSTTGASATFTLYPNGTSVYDSSVMTFGPCDDPSWVVNTHTITFDGGEITIVADIGTDMIITAPSQMKRAYGTIDGVSFDVTDYFRLLYRPGHHHFTRDFAVVLDTPVGDVCAIEVLGTDGQASTTTATLSTASCDLTVLGTRSVTAESLSTN